MLKNGKYPINLLPTREYFVTMNVIPEQGKIVFNFLSTCASDPTGKMIVSFIVLCSLESNLLSVQSTPTTDTNTKGQLQTDKKYEEVMKQP